MESLRNTYKVFVSVEDDSHPYEIILSVLFPKNRTILELKEFVEKTIEIRNLEGDIYYLENGFQRELLEECKLGGILFPNDCVIGESLLENNSNLYVDARYIQEYDEVDEEQMETNTMNPDYNLNQISRFIQELNSVSDIINTGLSNINNPYNLIQQMLQAPSTSNTQQTNHLGMFMNLLLGGSSSQRMEDVQVGLHKDDLESLHINLYKNFLEEKKCDTCSVCIEKFKEEDVVRELKCKHLFHRDCIDHWLENNIKCPLCREETGRGVPRL
jgi:hypothetical protein